MLSQILIFLLKFFVFTYLAIVFLLYALQEWMIFPRGYVPKQMPHHPSFELVSFKTSDQTTLHGMQRIVNPKAPTLLYFGGNAENVLAMSEIFAQFNNYNIIALNHRGYGLSEGKPSKRDILSDALEIYDHFSQQYSIKVTIGRSLGSSVATYLASKRPIQKLLLITPFDSIASIAQEQYPFIPIPWLLRHNFDTKTYMQSVHANVYIIDASHDEAIGREHSDALKSAISHLEFYQEIEGGHNSISYSPHYIQAIQRVLDSKIVNK